MISVQFEQNELVHLSKLLEDAGDHLSNAGCNDFPVENTDDNWALYIRVMAWGGDDNGIHERPPLTKEIYFYDWMLLRYLAKRLETVSN